MAISRADLSHSAIEHPDNDNLLGALTDLQEVSDYACEEGFPLPSDAAIDNAERLLRDVHKITPLYLEVYPTQDGEIAIHAPNGRGRSVMVLCASDGSALCLANLENGHRRKNYPNAATLPDKFLRRAFMDLESEHA